MTRDTLSQLLRHPVEVLAGLTLVVLGVLLTAMGAKPDTGQDYQIYLGGVGTAIGGIALSWTAGKAVSRSQALDELRAQLGLVSRNLGQAAGQISRVVDQCGDRSLPAETGFALVGQSAMLIGAQVNSIQGILGDPFETGDLLLTIGEMEKLAERLDRKGRRDADVSRVRTRLRAMRQELVGAAGRSSARVSEMVSCPDCGTPQEVNIGSYPGDTAVANCSACSARFNVHRRSDGSIFSRPARSSPSATGPNVGDAPPHHVSGTCPGCGEGIRVLVSPNAGKHKFAVCTKCGSSVIFNLESGGVTSDGSFEKVETAPTGRYGSGGVGARPVIRCDKCNRELRAVIRGEDSHFAIDNRCRRLLEVTNESFQRWRDENESAIATPAGSSDYADTVSPLDLAQPSGANGDSPGPT